MEVFLFFKGNSENGGYAVDDIKVRFCVNGPVEVRSFSVEVSGEPGGVQDPTSSGEDEDRISQHWQCVQFCQLTVR